MKRPYVLWLGMGMMWTVFAVQDMKKNYPAGVMMDCGVAVVFLLISAVLYTLRQQ
jgi:hypothetical protein